MKNYNEIITKTENLENLKAVIGEINNDILDNTDFIFDFAKLEKTVKAINDNFKNDFSRNFALAIETDRKSAFENLLKNPNFDKIVIAENENGTFELVIKKSLFKFSDLEKYYQGFKSTETDKNGKTIVNKSATVFGALRFYGLCDAFIRNMFTDNLTIDSEKIYNLEKIKIADKNIFSENDGKCFASNSNNALEKQLNILTRFFEIDVKMLKRDLPILKMSVQKIKRDIETNKASIHETSTLKFADILFSVITTRYKNENIKVFTNNGKEAEEIKPETKTEKVGGITKVKTEKAE